jgi:hypothetical protein
MGLLCFPKCPLARQPFIPHKFGIKGNTNVPSKQWDAGSFHESSTDFGIRSEIKRSLETESIAWACSFLSPPFYTQYTRHFLKYPWRHLLRCWLPYSQHRASFEPNDSSFRVLLFPCFSKEDFRVSSTFHWTDAALEGSIFYGNRVRKLSSESIIHSVSGIVIKNMRQFRDWRGVRDMVLLSSFSHLVISTCLVS